MDADIMQENNLTDTK